MRTYSFRLFFALFLVGGFAASRGAQAQGVPVPFASTYAGGGTACAASLPVYAVTGTGASYGDGCPATQSVLSAPVATVTDTNGNVFIADQTHDLIRVVYNGGTALANAIIAANVQTTGLVPTKGNIYTIVGGVLASVASASTYYCNSGSTGTLAQNRQLNGCPGVETYVQPRGLAVDADGNLFFGNVGATSSLNVFYIGGTAVSKLITLESPAVATPQVGYTYNLAGTTASSYTGDGALAFKATLNTPRGVILDAAENIYFADNLNNVIRRIDSTTGFISTVAGHCVATGTTCTATATSGDGSAATSTAVNIDLPYGEVLDQYGNLFIAEGGSATLPGRIRVVYAGGTLPGITAPVVGNIYTYAGGGATTGTQAQQTTFQEVFGVSLDPEGYLYVTDYRTGTTGSNKIWRVDPTNGNIAAIIGNGGSALTTGAHCNGLTTGPTATDTRGDGCPGPQAYLNTPQEGVAFDARGNIYVDDRTNNVIRQFSYNNTFSPTATGTSVTQPIAFLYPTAVVPVTQTFSTEGNAAGDYSDGGGDTCALNTALTAGTTCVDYIKFAPTAAGRRAGALTTSSATTVISTLTFTGTGAAPVLTIDPGKSVALGTALQPLGVSADQLGNVYVSDGAGKRVLEFTIAGGAGTTVLAGLGTPRQSVTDNFGNFYVADSSNNSVEEITAGGASTVIGTGFNAPQGVAADPYGNIYIADTGNNRIVLYSPLTGALTPLQLSGFTLSAPTSLALDSNNDLFIIDTAGTRVLEIPFGATPVAATLPAGTSAAALALDPAGDLYIADRTTGSVLFIATGSTTATTLVSGLTTPTGVAVNFAGNLFVADSAATSVAGYNRSANATTFATTNLNSTSLPATLTLTNDGTTPLTLSTPPYTETGTNAAAFPASGTATCTAALVLAPGATCTQAYVFKPTTNSGLQTATVTFSDTAGQSVTSTLSGASVNLIMTTVTLTGPTATVYYGQTATYTVSLSAASMGAAAPGGNITLQVDGKTYSSVNVTANPYTFPLTLTVGTHAIAAIYSGDSNYAGSNAQTSITIAKAMTTTTSSYTQVASGVMFSATVTPTSTGSVAPTGNITIYVDGVAKYTAAYGTGTISTTLLLADGAHTLYAVYTGDSNYATSTSTTQNFTLTRSPTTTTLTSAATQGGFILTAKVVGTGTNAAIPSGTVTFAAGTTTIATVPLMNGSATYTTTTQTYATYTFTAAYSGDGLFQPSSTTGGADFFLTTPTTALSVLQGGQALGPAISIVSVNGFAGPVVASCSNLPANALCRFLPSPLAVTAGGTTSLSVQVFASVNPATAESQQAVFHASQAVEFALLVASPVLLLLCVRRRKSTALPFLVVLLAVSGISLAGCGSTTQQAYVTPLGTSTITVNVTDPATGNVRSTLLTLSVVSN